MTRIQRRGQDSAGVGGADDGLRLRMDQPMLWEMNWEAHEMALYEMRTYTLHVGKMAEAVKLYTELGYPALQRGGQVKKLIGYFQADTGTINQLVHLWKFDDDADRRAHWKAVFANKDFIEGFATKFRPLVVSQEVKLLTAAPWGPHP